MDRNKSKKIQNIRIIATNIFMSLSVVAIVFVLMFIAMGFSFNESGKLEQAGLVQLTSRPSDANVEIDGEAQFSHTESSKMLSAGKHKIKITKSGYDTWERDVKIDAGLLTRVDWIRLFPENPELSEAYNFNELRFASFSPNHKYLLAVENGSNKLLRFDIQGDKLNPNELSLNECLSTTAANAVNGTISIIAWNENNTRLIAKWTVDDKTSWHLFNLDSPEKSIDISRKFNLSFDSILVANDSASKLWALENGNLRLIDTDNLTISGSIATNIEKIAHSHNVVSFINIENDKKYHLNTFKEGEESYVSIATLDNINKDTTVKLAMGTYWKENWLTYSINNHVYFLSGSYPSYGKDKNPTLKTKLDQELNFTPQLLSVNANQRIAVYSGDAKLFSYDTETDDHYSAELNSKISSINWIDGYLIWQNTDNNIIVRDFDGSNRRQIISDINNPFPVTISENNRWLYYFDMIEQETSSNSTSPSDSDPAESASRKKLTYTLKREKLQ